MKPTLALIGLAAAFCLAGCAEEESPFLEETAPLEGSADAKDGSHDHDHSEGDHAGHDHD